MKQNILPEMINTLRKERHLTLEELGEKLGKSKAAISRWCKGDRSPMIEDLERLAEIFDTDITTLLYGQRRVSVSKQLAEIISLIKQMDTAQQSRVLTFAKTLMAQQNKPRIAVPVIEALAAGIGYAYGNNEMTTQYTDRTDLKSYDIASAVLGDSMEPLIKNNDVVLIKKDRQFISGNLYAIDYDSKSYLKKVYFEKEQLRLVSINEAYDDILIPLNTTEYLNIVGEIVDWFTPVE